MTVHKHIHLHAVTDIKTYPT